MCSTRKFCRVSHVFECIAGRCLGKNGRDVRRYLDKGDGNSTGNLRKHAKICWGKEVVEKADGTRDLSAAREALVKVGLAGLRDGSITTEFERIGKGKISYSHREHTRTEARYIPITVFD